MKTARQVAKAAEPQKSVQTAPPAPQLKTYVNEAESLSVKRLQEGASTETEILIKILERTESVSHLRHWGINE